MILELMPQISWIWAKSIGSTRGTKNVGRKKAIFCSLFELFFPSVIYDLFLLRGNTIALSIAIA